MGPESNKKFQGSVVASIAYAYCTTKDYEKAISNMQVELDLERDLEDIDGQCRVLSNLGYTYYKMRKFDKSLESHRRQMTLAMRAQLFQSVASALNALGHIHVARNDFRSAVSMPRAFHRGRVVQAVGSSFLSALPMQSGDGWKSESVRPSYVTTVRAG